MSDEEALRHVARYLKHGLKIGDVSLELVQVEGGVEVNGVGSDGVGVGFTYPDDIGMPLFSFVQKRIDATGLFRIRVGTKNRSFPVKKYVYLGKPALRVILKS